MPATMQEVGAILRSEDLTEGEKIIVKWQFRILGDFQTALMEAIGRADDDNLERISRGFPDHVSGFMAWSRGGLGQRLRKMGLDI